jgi:hypothetical protein
MRSILITILLFVSATANASAVTWTFQDVVFDDGATLSGSFVYGGDSGFMLGETGLSVTGGDLSDKNYINWSGGVNSESLNITVFQSALGANHSGERVLQLAILGDLTVAGTISLTPAVDYADILGASGPPPGLYYAYNREGFCTTAGCGLLDVTGAGGRNLVSGTIAGVAAVPIPAAVWLFGSALAGLGWLRRKQIS